MTLTLAGMTVAAIGGIGWCVFNWRLQQRVYGSAACRFEAKRAAALEQLGWAYARDEISQLDLETAIEKTLAADEDQLANLTRRRLKPPPKPIDAAYSARPPFARGIGPVQLTPCPICRGVGCSQCTVGGHRWPETFEQARAVAAGVMTANDARAALAAAYRFPGPDWDQAVRPLADTMTVCE